MREDDLEEIVENIEGNLEEDAKSSASGEGEIPPKEEENLNQSSGEEEKCTCGMNLSTKQTTFASSVTKVLKNRCE